MRLLDLLPFLIKAFLKPALAGKPHHPDAAIQGIRAMCKPTVLIGGGYDKESEYDEWIEAFRPAGTMPPSQAGNC